MARIQNQQRPWGSMLFWEPSPSTKRCVGRPSTRTARITSKLADDVMGRPYRSRWAPLSSRLRTRIKPRFPASPASFSGRVIFGAYRIAKLLIFWKTSHIFTPQNPKLLRFSVRGGAVGDVLYRNRSATHRNSGPQPDRLQSGPLPERMQRRDRPSRGRILRTPAVLKRERDKFADAGPIWWRAVVITPALSH